jgi:hypothetical protein
VSSLIKIVVVLALLLLGVDRGGDYLAEQAAAKELQRSVNLPTQPDVAIDGFPFLPQFLKRRYQHVELTAADVRLSRQVSVARVHLDFRGVTSSRDFRRFHARTATARATIGYRALSKVIGVRVVYAGGNKVRASKQFSVLGQDIRPAITVEPQVLKGAVSFANATISHPGNVPPFVSQQLRDLFGASVALDQIPFDVRVTSVSAHADGLRLSLAGKDLSYVPPK